jgi:hypothetical protein
MQVQELTKKIHEDYPEVYEEIKDWIRYYKSYIIYCDYSIRYKDVELDDFSMFYGLLEDFFEEKGIIITFDWKYLSYKSNHITWKYDVVLKRSGGNGKDETEISKTTHYVYKSKQESKIVAILKACEILEDKLNG